MRRDAPLGRVGKAVVAVPEGTTTQADGRQVGEAGAAAAAGEAGHGPAQSGPPRRPRRHPLAPQDRRPLARAARVVRPLADRGLPLPPLAASRRLGLGPGGAPGRGGRPRGAGLEPARRRRDRGAGAPARGGGQTRSGDRTPGRGRGGCSTELHLRAEGGGKPVARVLTPGQPDGATQVPALLERGAVARPGRGRPRVRPDQAAGDQGDTGRPVRGSPRRRGIGAVTPGCAPSGGAGCASTGPPTESAAGSSARSTASRGSGRSPPATTNWPPTTTPPSPPSGCGSSFADTP